MCITFGKDMYFGFESFRDLATLSLTLSNQKGTKKGDHKVLLQQQLRTHEAVHNEVTPILE